QLSLEVLAHLGVGLAREQLTRVGDVGFGAAVLTVRVDHRLQLCVAAPGVARGGLVPARVELGQLRLERLELGLQVSQVLEHAPRVPRCVACLARCHFLSWLVAWQRDGPSRGRAVGGLANDARRHELPHQPRSAFSMTELSPSAVSSATWSRNLWKASEPERSAMARGVTGHE